MTYQDPIKRRAEKIQAAKFREKRKLVCVECVMDADFVFGGVHSDRACARCGLEPMGPGAVVGSSPWAGGIPFG